VERPLRGGGGIEEGEKVDHESGGRYGNATERIRKEGSRRVILLPPRGGGRRFDPLFLHSEAAGTTRLRLRQGKKCRKKEPALLVKGSGRKGGMEMTDENAKEREYLSFEKDKKVQSAEKRGIDRSSRLEQKPPSAWCAVQEKVGDKRTIDLVQANQEGALQKKAEE